MNTHTYKHTQVLNVDWTAASCLFIYLVPAGMKALGASRSRFRSRSLSLSLSLSLCVCVSPPPTLTLSLTLTLTLTLALIAEQLQSAIYERGVRVVTYVFSIPGLTPKETRLYKGSTKMYLYQR